MTRGEREGPGRRGGRRSAAGGGGAGCFRRWRWPAAATELRHSTARPARRSRPLGRISAATRVPARLLRAPARPRGLWRRRRRRRCCSQQPQKSHRSLEPAAMATTFLLLFFFSSQILKDTRGGAQQRLERELGRLSATTSIKKALARVSSRKRERRARERKRGGNKKTFFCALRQNADVHCIFRPRRRSHLSLLLFARERLSLSLSTSPVPLFVVARIAASECRC